MLKSRRTIPYWAWPAAFALLVAGFGWNAQQSLERTMRAQVASQLTTALESSRTAMDIWADEHAAVVQRTAEDPRVAARIEKLVELARETGDSAEALRNAPEQDELRALIEPIMTAHGYTGWGGQIASGVMVTNLDPNAIGERPISAQGPLAEIFKGRMQFVPPIVWDGFDDPSSAVITILIAAPVRNAEGKVISSLGVALWPEAEFSRILNVARPGQSGETLAFDGSGAFLSRSRFEAELRDLGLMPKDEAVTSALAIHARWPGGNMRDGYEPELPMAVRPFTHMAALAIAGQNGMNLDGYPDHRGVEVVGAWEWDSDLSIGLATEIETAEAYAGLAALRLRLAILVGLLLVGALGMLAYSASLSRMRGEVEEARQLGRYTILRKIGEGGMGTVYVAKHALLRRPTAVKVLDAERASDEAAARFEREVQYTSALTHPNTIEIFDYGYTPEGSFYYAMELLRGITLATCIDRDGAQPEARVLSIMRQAASSLAEAHAVGLIHRDLKPANIMLCECGGMLDFVKVLDFGLVRKQEQPSDVALTSVDALTGTPQYMSPESVESPESMDARSDVYQLGVIAYALLTGATLFEGDSVVDVLAAHMHDAPVPPSERAGRAFDPDLEALVLRCLEKNPDDRPADARELLVALDRIHIEPAWNDEQARLWWSVFLDAHPDALDTDPNTTTGTLPSAWEVDFHRRINMSGSDTVS